MGNFSGIEKLNIQPQPEEGRSLLDDALLKIEAQKKDIVLGEKYFSEYFDCPYFRYTKSDARNVTEIKVDSDGDVYMRRNCLKKVFSLGSIAKDDLSKILSRRKMLHKKLLEKILEENPEKKLTCQSCSRVMKNS
jgi:radical SAM protein with 4Fe4S-binding SPASM domain